MPRVEDIKHRLRLDFGTIGKRHQDGGLIAPNLHVLPIDSELTRDLFLVFPATTAALPVGLTSGLR
jgi:hypothetical protein